MKKKLIGILSAGVIASQVAGVTTYADVVSVHNKEQQPASKSDNNTETVVKNEDTSNKVSEDNKEETGKKKAS